MFYFLLSSLLSYKVLLIIAAVVPALFLMVKVYRSDRLEPEDPAFLWVLIRSGILAALIALVLERVFGFIRCFYTLSLWLFRRKAPNIS